MIRPSSRLRMFTRNQHSSLSNLDLVYIEKGDLEGAEYILGQAVTRNPTHTESLENLGTLFLETGKAPEAAAMFKKAAAL